MLRINNFDDIRKIKGKTIDDLKLEINDGDLDNIVLRFTDGSMIEFVANCLTSTKKPFIDVNISR